MNFFCSRPEFFWGLGVIPFIFFFVGKKSQPNKKTHMGFAGLRSFLVLLLILMLVDIRLVKVSESAQVFFLLDQSKSVLSDSRKKALEWIHRAASHKKEGDRIGLIVFGKSPHVEYALSENGFPLEIRSLVNPNGSDLAGAILSSVGHFLKDSSKKIVVFTDGNADETSVLNAAHLARSLDIKIFPVGMSTFSGEKEAYVRGVTAPQIAALNTPFHVSAHVVSGALNQAEILFFKNRSLFVKRRVQLKPGKNKITIRDMIKDPGFYTYKAILNARVDTLPDNNENIAFTRVSRKSSILFITSKAVSNIPLVRALEGQGISIIPKKAKTLSLESFDFMDVSAIILDNVSANHLSFSDMEKMAQFVKEMGGGLIMIGGNQSFGAGNFGKTPIEKVLPVFLETPAELEYPGLILVIIMDKSSSMTGGLGSESKLDMAKMAAFSAAEYLSPSDELGIIAFDMDYQWVTPITRVKSLNRIAHKLSVLNEDGGTTLYPALEDALKQLKKKTAAKKHVIVLSDGHIEKAAFQDLVESGSDQQITISTVALGTQADIHLMTRLALWGKGRSYVTEDVQKVPKIFIDETRIAGNPVIKETKIKPIRHTYSDMIKGLTQTDWPECDGMVITHVKPAAKTVLTSDHGPLLVTWRHGLGKVIAYTSDLNVMWQKNWVAWDQYPRFVAQMVKDVLRPMENHTLDFKVMPLDDTAVMTADINDDQNRFHNLLDIHANIRNLVSGNYMKRALQQIAPGRYRGNFPVQHKGEYHITLFNDDPVNPIVYPVAGYAAPYSKEYAFEKPNHFLLNQMAHITDGEVMNLFGDPSDVFKERVKTPRLDAPLWPCFCFIFLLLFFIEIVLRKRAGQLGT